MLDTAVDFPCDSLYDFTMVLRVACAGFRHAAQHPIAVNCRGHLADLKSETISRLPGY